MIRKNEVRKNQYYDSVTLMVASSEMRRLEGVENAAVMMGTDHNRMLMTDAELIGPDTEEFGVNDTVIGVLAESEAAAQAAISLFEEILARKKSDRDGAAERRVRSP